MGNDRGVFIGTYGSSSSHILRGELYRSVTSLIIHTNVVHLAGNIVGITVFGTAVCAITGSGVGWLMILITGIVGNVMNAVLYKTGHLSVGASTAVFGTIGILAAHQFFKKFRLPGERMKAWLPLAGGLALLGILGSGEHTDLTAHLFGFTVGIILGAVYSVVVKRRPAWAYQACSLLIALVVLVMSWMRPFGTERKGSALDIGQNQNNEWITLQKHEQMNLPAASCGVSKRYLFVSPHPIPLPKEREL